MNDMCMTEQVILQENGIIRDGQGKIIGHLIKDVDTLCENHYKRGYAAGLHRAEYEIGLLQKQYTDWT